MSDHATVSSDPSSDEAASSRGTSTYAFGAGKRESHDASGFYARFTPPVISDDETVVAPADRPVQDAL